MNSVDPPLRFAGPIERGELGLELGPLRLKNLEGLGFPPRPVISVTPETI